MRAVLEAFRSGDPVAIVVGVWLFYFAFHGATLGLEKAFPRLRRWLLSSSRGSAREFLIARKKKLTDLVRNGQSGGRETGAGRSLVERKRRIAPWNANGLWRNAGERPVCPDILKPLYDAAAKKLRVKEVFDFVPFSRLEQYLPLLVNQHKLVFGSLFPTLRHLVNNEELRIVGKFMAPCSDPVWLFQRDDPAVEGDSSQHVGNPAFWPGKTISVYGELMSTTVLLLDWFREQGIAWRVSRNGSRPESTGPNEGAKEDEEVTVRVMYAHDDMLWHLKSGVHDLAWIPYPLNMSVEAQEACNNWATWCPGPVNWDRWKGYPLNVAVTDMATLTSSNGTSISSMLLYVGELNDDVESFETAQQVLDRWKRTRDKDAIMRMLDSLELVRDPWIVEKNDFADQVNELWECGIRTKLLLPSKLNGQLLERIVTQEALMSLRG
jgi:hypothetical protein